jgi:excinuclease UvrABC nuclease subunit
MKIGEPDWTGDFVRVLVVDPRPGCYAWVNTVSGKILRIGRSTNLRRRLCGYLADRSRPVRAMWDAIRRECGGSLEKIGLRVWYTRWHVQLEKMLLDRWCPRFNHIGGEMGRS